MPQTPSPSSAFQFDASALTRFLSFCQLKHYQNRATIFRPGDQANTIVYVKKGKLSIVVEEADGKELVLGTAQTGDFIGEMGLFVSSEKRGVWLRAMEPCEIAEIEYQRLLDLMQGPLHTDAPKILYSLGSQLSKRLLETTRKASSLALLDVAGRIWRALEDLTKDSNALSHPQGTQIKVSRHDLARMVGCSREMAGRVIKDFVQEGKIHAHGKTMVIYHPAKTMPRSSQ